MVGLLDIAETVGSVTVGGKQVSVYGISFEGVAKLLGRFPILVNLLTQKSVTAADLLASGPEAVAAMIAAGCGYPGNDVAEEKASRLAIDTQLDLLSETLKRTMPKGVGPFVEKLTALGNMLGGGGASETLPVGAIKLRAKSSPKPSNSSEQQATVAATSGA